MNIDENSIVDKTINMINQYDVTAVKNYLTMKGLSSCPMPTTLTYEPYKYLIRDNHTFYAHAIIRYETRPFSYRNEPEKLILGRDYFRGEELLYLHRDSGKIYYESYSAGSILVSDSLDSLWRYFADKYKTFYTDIFNTVNDYQYKSCEKEQKNLHEFIKQNFLYEDHKNVFGIYDFLLRHEKYLKSDSSFVFADETAVVLSKDNFFEKSSFNISLPFNHIKIINTYKGSCTFLEIGYETEDEDTGPADEYLVYCPETRNVLRVEYYRYSSSTLRKSALADLGRQFPLEYYDNHVDICDKKSQTAVDPQMESLDTDNRSWKKRIIRFFRWFVNINPRLIYVDYEIVSDSLSDFISRLQEIDKLRGTSKNPSS